MTDTTIRPTNQPIKQNRRKAAYKGSMSLAMLAAIISSYVMTQLSLAGVDFTAFGVDSELVKSTIIGQLVIFFGWATPTNIIHFIKTAIAFIYESIDGIRRASHGKE